MESYIHTAVVAITGMIAILSLILGLERMIRIIMANYLIASILLGLGNFIELVSQRLLIGQQAERWVDGLQNWLGKALIAGKPTLLLTVYFVLLLVIVTKSHIGIGRVKNDIMKFILTILFLPCTIISILFSIGFAIFGTQVLDINGLQGLASYLSGYPYAYNFVMLTPLWIILPGLITIAVAALVLRSRDRVIKKEFVLDFDNIQETSSDELIIKED